MIAIPNMEKPKEETTNDGGRMMEDDYVTISREYIKELEEKAKDCEYYRGYINGLESVLTTIENIFTERRGNK